MKRYVIAIGGNALEEKKSSLPEIFRQIAGCIAHLIEKGGSIAIVFGNGPQVGKLVMQNHYASKEIEENTIDECVAMTQALIGYQLEKELGNALLSYGVKRNIVNVITQVVVDEQELAHAKPTKPIGAAYSKEEADRLCRERPGIVFKEDSLRGWRRVVVSPKPLRIREIETIRALLEQENIVIAGGGGGIPVIEKADKEYLGVDAVIDKDYTAERIAEDVEADVLVLLTGVEYVAIHYGREEQQNLKEISSDEMKQYEADGEFSEGSMLPKVKAALQFAESRPGREAVIGTLAKLEDILAGTSGTRIKEAEGICKRI